LTFDEYVKPFIDNGLVRQVGEDWRWTDHGHKFTYEKFGKIWNWLACERTRVWVYSKKYSDWLFKDSTREAEIAPLYEYAWELMGFDVPEVPVTDPDELVF